MLGAIRGSVSARAGRNGTNSALILDEEGHSRAYTAAILGELCVFWFAGGQHARETFLAVLLSVQTCGRMHPGKQLRAPQVRVWALYGSLVRIIVLGRNGRLDFAAQSDCLVRWSTRCSLGLLRRRRCCSAIRCNSSCRCIHRLWVFWGVCRGARNELAHRTAEDSGS